MSSTIKLIGKRCESKRALHQLLNYMMQSMFRARLIIPTTRVTQIPIHTWHLKTIKRYTKMHMFKSVHEMSKIKGFIGLLVFMTPVSLRTCLDKQ